MTDSEDKACEATVQTWDYALHLQRQIQESAGMDADCKTERVPKNMVFLGPMPALMESTQMHNR
jgi:hypothetical protein